MISISRIDWDTTWFQNKHTAKRKLPIAGQDFGRKQYA